jgi:hypothetical protein
MAYDNSTYRRLYRSLISLYPPEFKDQLGESMEQTFNDLCRERTHTGRGVFLFALTTFINTGVSIIKEEVRTHMKSPAFKIVLAINVVVTAILFILWWANGREDTWLYATSCVVMLASLISVKRDLK